MKNIFISEDDSPLTWSEASAVRDAYGSKAAGLTMLPKAWTLPFIIVPAANTQEVSRSHADHGFWNAVRKLVSTTGKLIIRSSVIGETIWERGKYKSIIVDASSVEVENTIEACAGVLSSAGHQPSALIFQAYLEPKQRGEFGNLLRISKTRDHWQLTTHNAGNTTASRLNTQRDAAASEHAALSARSGLSAERLFASVAAWINNILIRGHAPRPLRFNCEWVGDNKAFYLVQIDAEDEDLTGVNPLQLTISPIHEPLSARGRHLQPANNATIAEWDKLKVLQELWGSDVKHRPGLFVLPLEAVPSAKGQTALLAADFENLLGPNNIVVRTSIKAGAPKALNLPRTDCLTPEQASNWCVSERERLVRSGKDISQLAFVAHRYIDARSSAWARANANDPSVEIHSIWGLPDGLQYCPYDIWEVHVFTESATEYTEYKSNILLAGKNGEWEYIRVKNEVARSLSISRKDALDIARRTHEIAVRLNKSCHVMWFVGCVDQKGHTFNIPWYWTEARAMETNADRTRHQPFIVANRASLEALKSHQTGKSRLVIVLRPDDPNLFRDNEFIQEVADEARNNGIPIDLQGSTLAHAYYQLLDHGCTVVATGEKDHSRVRKLLPFGKIVRDKIPEKIASRKELNVTTSVPPRTQEAFLIGKILEEALEVRESETPDERLVELSDLLEIIRALAHTNGFSLDDVVRAADKKRAKLGGFEGGHVLLQTGIGAPGQTELQPSPNVAQVLGRSLGSDTKELPFTFFGFVEIGQPRTLYFEEFGLSLELVLKSDRLVVRMLREPEQLELPLSLEVDPTKDVGE